MRPNLNRRNMKRKILVVTLLLCCVALTNATRFETSFKGPVGLQLYSLRDQFKKDVPATLDQVRAFGITNVELAGTYGIAPERFKQELDARGLTAISAHFGYEQCRDHIEDVAREAKV